MDIEGEVRNILEIREMPKKALSKIAQNRQNDPELIHKFIVHKVNELSVVHKNQLCLVIIFEVLFPL